MAKKQYEPPEFHCTLEDLAKWAGITKDGIMKVTRENPTWFEGTKVSRGKYDFFGWTKAYTEKVIRKADGLDKYTPSDDELNLAYERARLYRANANTAEFELEVDQGKFIPIEDVKIGLTAIQLLFNSSIDAIPKRIAADIANKIADEFDMEVKPALIYEILKPEAKAIRERLVVKFEQMLRESEK